MPLLRSSPASWSVCTISKLPLSTPAAVCDDQDSCNESNSLSALSGTPDERLFPSDR